jgi:hypothetical protein
MSKFKVGEAVTLVKNEYWHNRMDHWHNTIQIIEKIGESSFGHRYWFKNGGEHTDNRDSEILNSWFWLDSMVVSVENKPVMKIKIKI